mmetsp:Transcript_11891/g.13088  ORF Transcript_11891/g.13088 Transcript_11891/m.13088 type:complete len:304 (+) Transcript_11891:35-946(+)
MFASGLCLGSRYGDIQQDCIAIVAPENSPKSLYIVADGHGILGERASQITCDTIKSLFNKALQTKQRFDKKWMTHAFKVSHSNVLAEYDKLPTRTKYPVSGKMETLSLEYLKVMDVHVYKRKSFIRPAEFGCTCTCVIMDKSNRTATIGYVGDSTTSVVQSGDDDQLVLQKITADHNAKNPREVSRITKEFSATFTRDGYLAPSPKKHKGMQVQTTRAIGHKILSQYGVVPEPEFRSHWCSDNDIFLLIASDGLWDYSDKVDITGILRDGEDITESAEMIKEELDTLAGLETTDNGSFIIVKI